MGIKGLSAGAEGFLRGSVAATLKILCDAGKLGDMFKGINPTLLGTVVALVMQTVKNSILVAAGKMSIWWIYSWGAYCWHHRTDSRV